MQSLFLVFMALLLAHLLADFPFQTGYIIRNKSRQLSTLGLHGAVHYALAWVCLLFFEQVSFFSLRNQIILLTCVLLHLAVDRLKSLLVARGSVPDNGWTFLTDQLIHLATLAIAAWLVARSNIAGLVRAIHISSDGRARIVETAVIYVAIVFGGGYLIRYLTRGIAHGIRLETSAQLGNAGLYIGWMERALVITAMIMQSPALVGLILTGKSIARFPEFKEVRFAEYFLIGTLLSFLLSVVGGLILLHLLYGTVSLK